MRTSTCWVIPSHLEGAPTGIALKLALYKYLTLQHTQDHTHKSTNSTLQLQSFSFIQCERVLRVKLFLELGVVISAFDMNHLGVQFVCLDSYDYFQRRPAVQQHGRKPAYTL